MCYKFGNGNFIKQIYYNNFIKIYKTKIKFTLNHRKFLNHDGKKHLVHHKLKMLDINLLQNIFSTQWWLEKKYTLNSIFF